MVYSKTDVAGNGSTSKNNWLIYNVWWEQGSVELRAVLRASGPLLTPTPLLL